MWGRRLRRMAMTAGALLLVGWPCFAEDGTAPEVDEGVPEMEQVEPPSPKVVVPNDLGVFYDPRVDYDEGVFDAEEEISKGQETIWVLSYDEKPPAKDPDTGLPIKYIVVDPNEPWHQKCMKERIRGHNMHIHLELAKRHPASKEDQVGEKSVTDDEPVDQQ
jgi:hypothetical protein